MSEQRVRSLLWGFRQSCLALTAVRVGLVDRLARGAAPVEDLARELGLDAGALRRFLRALASLDLVARAGGGFALTEDGRALHSLRHFATLIGAEYMPAWRELEHSLRTGETAFAHVFGVPVWEHRKGRPELGEALNRTMSAYQQSLQGAILAAYDFSRSRVLVDVGSSYGDLTLAILARSPEMRAVLFDQPEALEGMRRKIAEAGCGERCLAVAGSFFEAVPPGGDTYLLKHILHNWDDDRCRAILAQCRRQMPAGARLVVIENVLRDEAGKWHEDGHWNDFALDMHMLGVLGGQLRRLDELDALFAATGFARTRHLVAGGLTDVIEAEALPA